MGVSPRWLQGQLGEVGLPQKAASPPARHCTAWSQAARPRGKAAICELHTEDPLIHMSMPSDMHKAPPTYAFSLAPPTNEFRAG